MSDLDIKIDIEMLPEVSALAERSPAACEILRAALDDGMQIGIFELDEEATDKAGYPVVRWHTNERMAACIAAMEEAAAQEAQLN